MMDVIVPYDDVALRMNPESSTVFVGIIVADLAVRDHQAGKNAHFDGAPDEWRACRLGILNDAVVEPGGVVVDHGTVGSPEPDPVVKKYSVPAPVRIAEIMITGGIVDGKDNGLRLGPQRQDGPLHVYIKMSLEFHPCAGINAQCHVVQDPEVPCDLYSICRPLLIRPDGILYCDGFCI